MQPFAVPFASCAVLTGKKCTIALAIADPGSGLGIKCHSATETDEHFTPDQPDRRTNGESTLLYGFSGSSYEYSPAKFNGDLTNSIVKRQNPF